ncbi:uncharacterized protein LOC129876397 [Solanum dulcamara]|uniref:uncharacterized protein LOC129876397 n=1 Tax=Solanum dulcamara TaxID=45834 RepID=UPI00248520DF|nr:uncharacterized protein LOC129876397 [Solanum dulcamara]XP_055807804.1 uncharacterized protein LOC129876397 [Solanum dulcamara]XP_055807805.1 uncharacterized protein LOC129876397 [Solanum dulcamara]XP_055807806.1 uncharacterized protein LOC129876397 [Solanum dulcamara]
MAIDQSNSATKLSLFLTPKAMKLKYSPLDHDHHQHSSGILTPPLHTNCLASVPFKWELHPGKPRPYCTDIIISNIFNDQTKCLEPPPRLYYLDKITKIPSSSNTHVLERGQFGTLVLYENNIKKVHRRGPYWWQRFVKRRVRKETGVGGGNLVISTSSSDCCNSSSLSNGRSHSRIWGSMYEGFKHVIPWKGKKSEKEVLIKTQT